MSRRLLLAALTAGMVLVAPALWAAPPQEQSPLIRIEPSEKGAVVKIGDELFTEYIRLSGIKPILWPVIGPTGQPMTRAYPMGEAPDEKQDHPHHRSLWFTHGDVNGVNFWNEGDQSGRTVHREFVKLQGGPQGIIVTRNDWLGPDGKKILEDERTFVFGVDRPSRWIDMDIALHASQGPVTFGDTKEGSGGVRVAGPLSVTAKMGGRIINAHGQQDDAAWGKQAPWVDYHGPLGGQVVGIAIMNHPSSFRYPTYWHVRTYGLFTANPFGVSDFTGKRDAGGAYELPAGETITLRYRIFLHRGDEKEGRVAEAYETYAALKKGP